MWMIYTSYVQLTIESMTLPAADSSSSILTTWSAAILAKFPKRPGAQAGLRERFLLPSLTQYPFFPL